MRVNVSIFVLLAAVCVSGHPVADDPTLSVDSFQTGTENIRTLTNNVTVRLKSEPELDNINTNSEIIVENVSTESAIETDSDEEIAVHQFSLAEQVTSYTDYPLHPSAVVFTASNFTTNNPLDNLKDFSNWNASDIHDFQLNHENDIEGNEFSYIDQLAVESEHRSDTVAHTILVNDTHAPEHLTYNVTVSTDSSFSEEVTRVWVTTTLFSSTPQYEDEEKEEEMASTPKYFPDGVNPSREPELANVQESRHQVTDDQVSIPFRDDPSLTHYRTVYHDIMAPLKHQTERTEPARSVTDINQFTPGLLSVEEVHNHEIDNVEGDTFNDHFDLVSTGNAEKFDHADLDRETSYELSGHITPVYNSDLYEVVTSQIDPESDLAEEEESGVDEYENIESDASDAVVESEDRNIKYATFLDNLHSKYGVVSDTQDGNREHSPRLFEDSLSSLVKKDDNDAGLPRHDADSAPSLVGNPISEMGHPLVSLMKIEPHAMKLLVKPRKFEPDTMVRLMYERVPRNKPALQQHLDDPVIEYVHVYRLEQEHYLTDLPMGKYIVCGEAQINGEVFQANCFETIITRLDNNMLQGGVIAVIAVALLIVFCVIIYAIYHKVALAKRKDTERQ